MHYNRYSRSQRRTGFADYVVPFLILICVGVIFVLLFNLWQAMFSNEPTKGAYVHIMEGSVQMQPWKTDQFLDLNSDVMLLQGDVLKTSANAKVIVQFFDGTLMRVGGGSDLTFEVIEDDGGNFEIGVLLGGGQIWFNKVYMDTGDTLVWVKGANIRVTSDSGNIFDVESEFDEAVRVLGGEQIAVDIFGEDLETVVESENVGVGQEIVFSDKVIEKYRAFQSPTVLMAINDDFKQSDWYLWNTKEDKEPTEFMIAVSGSGNFVEVVPEEISAESNSEEEVDAEEGGAAEDELTAEDGSKSEEQANGPADGPENGSENGAANGAENGSENGAANGAENGSELSDANGENTAASTVVQRPTVTSVSGGTQVDGNGFYVVKGNPATLVGGAFGAAKIVVNGYTLTKFNSGDSTWTYFANADFSLMKQGENTYEVYAVAADGSKSESLFVKVLYQPGVGSTGEVSVESTEPSGEENESGQVDSNANQPSEPDAGNGSE